MMRVGEALAFSALAVALHILALALWFENAAGGQTSTPGVPTLLALQAPDAALLARVAEWETPPAATPGMVSQETPASAPPADLPLAAPPGPKMLLPPSISRPATDLANETPEETSAPALRPAPRPQLRAERESPRQPDSARLARAGAAGRAVAAERSASGPENASVQDGYGGVVRAAIALAQTYPALAQARGIAGAATLRVAVARDGRLLSAQMVRSSGSDLLDRASLAAAQDAAPFAPAPRALSGDRFAFEVRLVYVLQ
jgi:protein TonB